MAACVGTARLPGHPVTPQPAPFPAWHLGILSQAGETAQGHRARPPRTETRSAGKEKEIAGVQKVSQRMYKSAKEMGTLED